MGQKDTFLPDIWLVLAISRCCIPPKSCRKTWSSHFWQTCIEARIWWSNLFALTPGIWCVRSGLNLHAFRIWGLCSCRPSQGHKYCPPPLFDWRNCPPLLPYSCRCKLTFDPQFHRLNRWWSHWKSFLFLGQYSKDNPLLTSRASDRGLGISFCLLPHRFWHKYGTSTPHKKRRLRGMGAHSRPSTKLSSLETLFHPRIVLVKWNFKTCFHNEPRFAHFQGMW